VAIRVPAVVLEGLEAVRQSGKTNMFDRKAVQFWANNLEHWETVLWIEGHQGDYARGIFEGFEVEEDPGEVDPS
jgi:hypothetical protein